MQELDLLVCIVGRRGKKRKRRTCRCREKQDGSGNWMNE